MRPSALRATTLRWLLRLEWNGQVFRFAEEETTAPTGAGGADERYEGGLEIADYDDDLPMWTETEAPRSLSVTLHPGSVMNVVERVRLGWDLQAASARLMLWPDAGDERDVRTLLVGVLREPEHGSVEEPLTFTVAEEDEEAPGRIPDERAVYDAETWPGGTGDTDSYGERYPIILGRPGGGTVDGSHGLMPNTGRLIIAGHEVAATSCTVYDETNNTSESRPISHMLDSLNRQVATLTGFVTVGSPAGTLVAGDPYWIRWDSGGGLRRGTVEVRAAGEVLRAMLALSGARFDSGRTDAALGELAPYQIDAAIVAGPDDRIRPLDWLREHLLPILPISLRTGPDGLYPVVWRWEAQQADAEINADRGDASRAGPVAYSSRDDLANEIIMSYARSARTERHTARIGLTGDRVRAAADSGLDLNVWCERSYLRYGSRPRQITSDVVADSSTARRIVIWQARRYALSSRVIVYDTGLQYGHLEPGRVVSLTDSEIGFNARIAHVERVVWRSTGDIGLGLRVLDTPERG